MKEIEKCPEGGEGEVVNIERVNDILSINVCRCNNQECYIKNECKRSIQFEIDKQYVKHKDIVEAEFIFIPSSDPDFNYKEYCGKFIQN